MTKRTPYSPKKKKPSLEYQKRIAAIKTAIPLVLTLGLLALVYIFVMRPEEPANVLKRAVINSTDSSKYTSIRYDGSFGDTNRDIEGEFGGQKSATGNQDFRIRLTKDETSTSLETVSIDKDVYVRLSGIENAKTIAESITGAQVPSDATIQLLSEVQNKWIKATDATARLLTGAIPCADILPGLSQAQSVPITEENYPLVYESGPTIPKDDSEDEIYEAKLTTKQRTAGSFERQVTELIGCLEENYGKEDFRLREAGPQDVEAAKITLLVDPLSSTVKKFTYKQVGTYFVVNFRDYNKDVAISVPEGAVLVTGVYGALSDQSKAYLTTKFGIPALQ